MGKIQTIQQKDFTEKTSQGLVLVDFYADWCGPCRMITPVLEQLQEKMQDAITIVKIDVDTAQETAQQWGITSIPTLLFFKNGAMVQQIVGLKNLQELEQLALKFAQ